MHACSWMSMSKPSRIIIQRVCRLSRERGYDQNSQHFLTPGKRQIDKQLARPGKRKTVRRHLLGLTINRNTFSESSSTPECSVLGEQSTCIGNRYSIRKCRPKREYENIFSGGMETKRRNRFPHVSYYGVYVGGRRWDGDPGKWKAMGTRVSNE